MKGYVKNKDDVILYKVDVPDTASPIKLQSGEKFVSENDLNSIIIKQRTSEFETEKLILAKIREIAIRSLKSEGKISENEATVLLEKMIIKKD